MDLYGTIYNACIALSAAASVVGGYKVYSRWNTGEDVMPALSAWLLGLVAALILLWAPGALIMPDNAVTTTYAPATVIGWLAQEVYEVCLIVGVIMAIVGSFRIYKQFNAGEDIHEPIMKWVGSIFFLFFFGYVIEVFFS